MKQKLHYYSGLIASGKLLLIITVLFFFTTFAIANYRVLRLYDGITMEVLPNNHQLLPLPHIKINDESKNHSFALEDILPAFSDSNSYIAEVLQTNSGTNKKQGCPSYGFKIIGKPTINCVAIEWWALSTKVNMVDANGNFRQSNDPEPKSFTVQFRKQGDIYWTSDRRNNSGRNIHNLKGLDACTKYEIRLITTCDNGVVSDPSGTARITTACTQPSGIGVENITSTSAKVKSKKVSFSSYECGKAPIPVEAIEYRSTNSSIWNVMYCNPGNPCILNGLKPGTTYKIRSRYKYSNSIFSNYTNEAVFNTTGQPQKANSCNMSHCAHKCNNYCNQNCSHTNCNRSSGNYSSNSGNKGSGTLRSPSLIWPTNGVKITGYYFELSWNGVIGASSYEIQVSRKPTFSNAVTYTTTNTKYPPSNYGKGSVFYWKVRAKGTNGKYSFWSPSGKFTF